MSREVLYSLKDINYTGSGTIAYSNNELILTGYVWATDDNYIEINPTGNTYYYHIVLNKNTSGSQLYVGFERYDANKTATSNNSCVYVYSSTSAVSGETHIKGTVNLATDFAGNPTKYIKLRILNSWNSLSSTTNESRFKLLSLRETSSINSTLFKKPG